MANSSTPPVLGVKKLVGKTLVDRGEPVPVTIQLKGDQKKLCTSAAVAIVFDVSGSLGVWHGEVKAAIVASLPLISFGADSIAVASFDTEFTTLQTWSTSAQSATAALDGLSSSGGGTDLSNAVAGTNALMNELSGNPQCRAALVVTDGKGGQPSTSLLQVAKTKGWKYSFLGVGDQNKQVLAAMAAGSGGTYLDSSAPPFIGSVAGSIAAAVTTFFESALRIVAPTGIVLTEVVDGSLDVTDTPTPSVPPNQQNPATFTAAAGPAWTALATTGTATLPPIDRLGMDPSGARTEYSVDFEVAVDACDEDVTTAHWIDGPGAQVTYSVPEFGSYTVALPNLQVNVKTCSLPVEKTWTADDRIVTIEVTNNYGYVASEIELLEILNHPIEMLRTSLAPLDGGAGHGFARFALPDLAPGEAAAVYLWVAPTSPLSGPAETFQINNLGDSHVSFVVPWHAAELAPGTPEHGELLAALQQSSPSVTKGAKQVLTDAASTVAHASHMEAIETEPIVPNAGTPWPDFDWLTEGDRGTFLIKSIGSSYAVYVAHRKWNLLPELTVAIDELDP